ncbi:hypothetical protein VTL71DRAFT_6496 [Oculimacula yallundae]|uniref:Uncharacterized protein n=1 Tax=Oculimacula yallundae TaxID=86028 RepID=A0ABR4BX43_9HELO
MSLSLSLSLASVSVLVMASLSSSANTLVIGNEEIESQGFGTSARFSAPVRSCLPHARAHFPRNLFTTTSPSSSTLSSVLFQPPRTTHHFPQLQFSSFVTLTLLQETRAPLVNSVHSFQLVDTSSSPSHSQSRIINKYSSAANQPDLNLETRSIRSQVQVLFHFLEESKQKTIPPSSRTITDSRSPRT